MWIADDNCTEGHIANHILDIAKTPSKRQLNFRLSA